MMLLSFKQNCYLKPLLILCFFSILILSSSIVNAQAAASSADDPIGEKLCTIVNTLNGKTTKAICLVAIIFLGISTFMGKVNWSTAMITVCAIIIITQSSKVYEFIAKGANGSTAQCEKSS